MSYLNSVTTAHGVIDSVIAAHRMGHRAVPEVGHRRAVPRRRRGGRQCPLGHRVPARAAGSTTAAWSRPAPRRTSRSSLQQAGPELQLPRAGADSQRVHGLHHRGTARGAARSGRQQRAVPGRPERRHPRGDGVCPSARRRTGTSRPRCHVLGTAHLDPGHGGCPARFHGDAGLRDSTGPSSLGWACSTGTYRPPRRWRSTTSWWPTTRTSNCASIRRKTTAGRCWLRWSIRPRSCATRSG